MENAKRGRTAFGQRMLEARKRAGLSQMQVREKLGLSQGTLSELENTAQGSSHTVRFAELYGVDPTWLATGEADPNPLAHALSYRPDTVVTLSWGEMMQTNDLPEVFWVTLGDDAMAPRAPNGTAVRFRKSKSVDFERDAKFGDAVLFRAPDGSAHVRLLGQDLAHGFQLRPTNANYASFVGSIAGLELLGIMTAIETSWGQYAG